jgi:hypothetical protein
MDDDAGAFATSYKTGPGTVLVGEVGTGILVRGLELPIWIRLACVAINSCNDSFSYSSTCAQGDFNYIIVATVFSAVWHTNDYGAELTASDYCNSPGSGGSGNDPGEVCYDEVISVEGLARLQWNVADLRVHGAGL